MTPSTTTMPRLRDSVAAATAGSLGAATAATAQRISEHRARIDAIDAALISLWQERAGLSQQVGATRMADGGTRLVLAREREIVERYRLAVGADGVALAMLILRAGRGAL